MRKLAYFLAVFALCAYMGVYVTKRTQGILAARGVHVDATARATEHTTYQSTNHPSYSYTLDVRYPVGASTWRQDLSISYAEYERFKNGGTADVVYDPEDPATAALASSVREGTDFRQALVLALVLTAASIAMFVYSRSLSREPTSC